MIPKRLALSVLLVAASVLPGCSSPTEPSPTYALDVGGPSMGGYATFATVDGQPSILEFHVLLDGQEMLTGLYKYATPVASLQYAGGVFGARRGHHTLALKVTAQAVSPTVYQSNGIKMTLLTQGFSPTVVATVILPDQTKSLRTGESIDIEFDI